MQGKSDAPGAENRVSAPNLLPAIDSEHQLLAPYTKMLDKLNEVNSLNACEFMSSFMKAKDIASSLHSTAIYEYNRAHRERKKQWSIAKLDRAPDVLKRKGLKVTEAATSACADMDHEYLQAAHMEDYWEAKAEFFKNKVFSFNDAHKDVLAIYNKEKDPTGSISALPSGE